jgi:antirestriction protein ArdC
VRGYASQVWGTYKQWQEQGCQVRGGEKSAPVIFYKQFETEPEEANPDDDGKRRVMRGSRVFNAAQYRDTPRRKCLR